MKKIQSQLEKISHHYQEGNEFDAILTPFEMRTIKKYFAGKNFLELGCSVGDSTHALLKFADSIDVVEGSDKNIQIVKQKLSKLKKAKARVKFINQLWENFDFGDHYSDILWIRGIEHIEQPQSILRNVAASLRKSQGRLHLITVNALSLNRRIGTYMGILKDPHQLSDRDKRFGHYKIYDRLQLFKLLEICGFKILNWHGIMLKPLPNDSMYEIYKKNPKIIDAFYKISHELPDYCSEVYICASPI